MAEGTSVLRTTFRSLDDQPPLPRDRLIVSDEPDAEAIPMDVVFVGTASCTPAPTRGVSCTALRLNWRRQVHQAVNGAPSPSSSFVGGTWLFDVGECTQVRYRTRLECH